MKGVFVIFVGPSGSGKTVLMDHARSSFPEVTYLPSVSSREMRPGEVDCQKYCFVSREEFEKRVEEDGFIEWAEYAGNYYGTPKRELLELLNGGKTVIKEMELQGVRQVLEILPSENRKTVFVTASSWNELQQRILDRAPISKEQLDKRHKRFEDEMAFKDEADYVVVNENGKLEESKEAINAILREIVR